MPKRNAFVRGLIERFKDALSDEQGKIEAYEQASRELTDTRETKKLCAALLKKEGVDPAEIERQFISGGINPKVAQWAIEQRIKRQTELSAPRNPDEATPLNATHAVYLVLRKRNNAALQPSELVTASADLGMPLTLQEVNKVIWTQTKKGRMEKLDDGEIRLTPKGEAFNSFRRKAVGEAPSEAAEAA